jgi:hypothetical protein
MLSFLEESVKMPIAIEADNLHADFIDSDAETRRLAVVSLAMF